MECKMGSAHPVGIQDIKDKIHISELPTVRDVMTILHQQIQELIQQILLIQGITIIITIPPPILMTITTIIKLIMATPLIQGTIKPQMGTKLQTRTSHRMGNSCRLIQGVIRTG